MDIDKIKIQESIPSAFQSCLEKAKSNSKSFEEPTPRIFHSCISHRAFLFVYGGLSLNPMQEFQNEHLFVYRYEIHRFEWKKIQTNFPSNLGILNPLQNIYSHSCVVHGNVMYLFGGRSGKNGQCLNELWAMNLQSFNWRKQDQKGSIPSRRESASLALVNKSNLFLYGGKDQDNILNDIHIYKIESKHWFSVQSSNAEFLMPKRIRSGICVVNQIVYIFGGERESSVDNSTEILNDFYQVTLNQKKIKIVQKSTALKPDVWVKKLSSLLCPGKIISPKMVNINDKYIGLLQTTDQDDLKSHNKLWLHDPHKLKWIYSNLEDPNKYQLGFGYNAVFQYDRIYVCGGLKSDLTPLSSLYSIHVDFNDVPPNQIQASQKGRLCLLCEEEKHSLCRKKINGFSLFRHSLQQMTYPFNAFGLLVDNSNLLKSSFINIQCIQSSKQKYLVISDDGICENIWSNEDEFIEDMLKLRTISEQQMEVQDDELPQGNTQNLDQVNIEIEQEVKDKEKKKNEEPPAKEDPYVSKNQEQKEEERKLKKKKDQAKKSKAKKMRKRKQFSVNLKIGALRLAKKMIFTNETADGSKRVFYLQEIQIHSIDEESSSQKSEEIKYQCHYYMIPSPTGNAQASHHSCEASKQFVESECKVYLKGIQQNSNCKNHLILVGLRQMITEDGIKEPELKINTKLNDIYYGSNKLISKAQSLNISLPECIDVSLKSYLSMLYLKGQYAKITISTLPEKKQEVSNALYFDKIDNLVKSNAIMDLDSAFDLQECKIVELYYCKNLLESPKRLTKTDKKQKISEKTIKESSGPGLNVFLNGILIYHRNRLISRYDHPFGSLLRYNNLKKFTTKNYNPLRIFGFIELDEVFYSNIFKTNFVNEENLSNMYERIKFVEEFLQIKNHQAPSQISGKRSLSKKGQNQAVGELSESKKKVKGQ